MFSNQAIDIISEKAKFLAINVQSNAGNMGFNLITKYPRADFFTLAHTELRLALQEQSFNQLDGIKTILNKLSASAGIVTLGKRGCMAQDEKNSFKVPALAQKIVDRVGAGDALLAVSSLLK